jgi:hypothetical protein
VAQLVIVPHDAGRFEDLLIYVRQELL